MAQERNAQEQDINQLLKVRRDKLKELQDSGRDPFLITKYDVSHHSKEIKDNFESLEEKEVTVAGLGGFYVYVDLYQWSYCPECLGNRRYGFGRLSGSRIRIASTVHHHVITQLGILRRVQ